MNNEMSPVETDDDVERVWVAVFLDENIEDPMHTTL